VNVSVGQKVRIIVTSDVDNEVHVHGAEVEKELTAGQPGEIEAVESQPGIYEVELHHPALLLFQLVAR
jgi:hypothetical protein